MVKKEQGRERRFGTAYGRCILREIKGSFGRFIAIIGIVALGVGFLLGIFIHYAGFKGVYEPVLYGKEFMRRVYQVYAGFNRRRRAGFTRAAGSRGPCQGLFSGCYARNASRGEYGCPGNRQRFGAECVFRGHQSADAGRRANA